MENIILYPTNKTPFVYTNYNQGLVYVSGIAIPENAPQFFAGFCDWIETYLSRENKLLSIHIDLEYFNNPSSLCITDLVRRINNLDKPWVTLYWYHYSDDDDVREDGEDFAEIAKFPFQLIPVEKQESINISKSKTTPLVYFDLQGDYVIHGNAIEKEPFPFFLPVVKWLQNRRTCLSPAQISCELFLNQINTENFPFIKLLCSIIEILNNKGIKSSIVWKYNNPDVEQKGIEILSDMKLHYCFKEQPKE